MAKRSGLLIAIFCYVIAPMGHASPPAAAHTIAIVGGSLIDGNGKEPLEDYVVLIQANRITAVGPRGKVPIPPDAEIISAAGKTVLPGLVNSNCHLTLNPLDTNIDTWSKGLPKAQEVLRYRLRVLLMEGITSIRDTTGYIKPLLAVKQSVDKDEIPASRLFIGGRSIASPQRSDSRFLTDSKNSQNKEDEAYFRPIYKVPDDLKPIEGPEYNFWKISLTGGEYWGADNTISDELLNAIVQEGHRVGRLD